jgi:hypothetical protein
MKNWLISISPAFSGAFHDWLTSTHRIIVPHDEWECRFSRAQRAYAARVERCSCISSFIEVIDQLRKTLLMNLIWRIVILSCVAPDLLIPEGLLCGYDSWTPKAQSDRMGGVGMIPLNNGCIPPAEIVMVIANLRRFWISYRRRTHQRRETLKKLIDFTLANFILSQTMDSSGALHVSLASTHPIIGHHDERECCFSRVRRSYTMGCRILKLKFNTTESEAPKCYPRRWQAIGSSLAFALYDHKLPPTCLSSSGPSNLFRTLLTRWTAGFGSSNSTQQNLRPRSVTFVDSRPAVLDLLSRFMINVLSDGDNKICNGTIVLEENHQCNERLFDAFCYRGLSIIDVHL